MKTIYMESTIQYMGNLALESGDPKRLVEIDDLLKSGEIKKIEKDNGPTYLVVTESEINP